MKIKLTESQLKRILNEVGGYDDREIMSTHAGLLHGEINARTIELISMLGTYINDLKGGDLDKDDVLAGVLNLTNTINSYIERMKQLQSEIYLDDDFKELVNIFISKLRQVQKYFRLIANINRTGSIQGMGGLGVDMGKTELMLNISEKLSPLGKYIEKMGTMIATLVGRFSDRLN